jgi:prevent-host-death family protein
MKIGAYEAKTHLPALLDRVARGESITITRRGKPVAELRPDGGVDPARLQAALERLERLRLARSSARKPITVEEILAAKAEGRR